MVWISTGRLRNPEPGSRPPSVMAQSGLVSHFDEQNQRKTVRPLKSSRGHTLPVSTSTRQLRFLEPAHPRSKLSPHTQDHDPANLLLRSWPHRPDHTGPGPPRIPQDFFGKVCLYHCKNRPSETAQTSLSRPPPMSRDIKRPRRVRIDFCAIQGRGPSSKIRLSLSPPPQSISD